MGEDWAISLKNVSKCFKRYPRPVDRLKETFLPGKSTVDTFWALKNINLEIPKGQTVGVVGQNGSGKSTLLQIIAGTLTPTLGELQVNGRVGALLELGSGFNPEFTGRQNVFFYGRLLGLSQQEIEQRFDDIAGFAEIGDFIEQPVKTYSSGMFVRLAFSVVAQVNADILIIDEALSVGDMYFQKKCIEKMKSLKKQTSILYVSHSITSVRNFCDRAIWIKEGEVEKDGECSFVCEAYEDSFIQRQAQNDAINKQNETNKITKNIDNQEQEVVIREVTTNKSTYLSGEDITITLNLDFIKPIQYYGVGILIRNEAGDLVTLFNTVRDDVVIEKPHEVIKLCIPNNNFTRGTYFIFASIVDDHILYPYDKLDFSANFFVDVKKNNIGIPVAEGYFRADHNWIF
ncbi:ABC transporter ATP-binding protein [Anabaena subtropica]|uniref:ABC transporter ATP-binding protein n=1 Tax=Anabaena subtropica FACHB-260 TaxID=2692884 RepID=A0ABR8CTA9_9NOST|nr:ABC transporter ATP-binding protein [Anabaena subtropica]MBD2346118.1 ABC transporter ATP-binding protein [Anabaena subtropica FACHB-260]